MKEIKNSKSEVYLSTYDNSDLLLPVSGEHKDIENVCVAVKFGDTIIKISPKEICGCDWNKAMEKYRDNLMSPAYWQMVGQVHYEVTQALMMINQNLLSFIWTDVEVLTPLHNDRHAWYYLGYRGVMSTDSKNAILNVRPTLVFQHGPYEKCS